jgi:hypothetical protein
MHHPAIILPFGAGFKPLLSEAALSESDLNTVLQNRGVFLGMKHKNKASCISHLASTLLSPQEFAALSDMQRTKDSKTRPSSIQTDWALDNISLLSAMPDDIDLFLKKFIDENDAFCIESHQYKIEGESKISMDFTIRRKDWKKDALTNTNYHSCNITIEKTDNFLEIKTERTVSETKTLVENLRKSILDYLTKSGSINKESGVRQIMSDSFNSNESAFSYLISFLDYPFQHLVFERMLNVSAGIDSEKSFPDNLDWIRRDVAEISMFGSNIKDTDLIKAGESGALLFGEIEAEFTFSYPSASGTCVIRYGFARHFSGKKKSKRVEFEAKITKLNIKNTLDEKPNSSSLSRSILIEFQGHKYSSIEQQGYIRVTPVAPTKVVEHKVQLSLF